MGGLVAACAPILQQTTGEYSFTCSLQAHGQSAECACVAREPVQGCARNAPFAALSAAVHAPHPIR